MTPTTEQPWPPNETRRFTPLTIFGLLIAVFVAIDGLVLLRGTLVGGAFVASFLNAVLGGIVLFILWVGFLIAWWVRRRKWSWELLIIPLVGIVMITIISSGVTRKAVWNWYQEPRFTSFAEEILKDPQGFDRCISGRTHCGNRRRWSRDDYPVR